jgi:allantoicase
MESTPHEAAAFSGSVDLAAEQLGGRALLASDEFFAEKENLLKPGRGVFLPDAYTDRGKWMDGWESRRKRTPGHDWCIVRLGCPGRIDGFDIDTNHFLGNHPPFASVDACVAGAEEPGEALARSTGWTALLERAPLKPGSQNLFAVADRSRWTHVRLHIYPDGGVARFRVHGRVLPDWSRLALAPELDLAAVENGGLVTAASDMFFGSKENLILPGRAANMGGGWETRRRRGPGFDWAIVQLGRPGTIQRIDVDTHHYKGNYPDRCSIEACHAPDRLLDVLDMASVAWTTIVPESRLQADTRHPFEREIVERGPWSHVRLNVFPDGGVSRLRVWGKPS